MELTRVTCFLRNTLINFSSLTSELIASPPCFHPIRFWNTIRIHSGLVIFWCFSVFRCSGNSWIISSISPGWVLPHPAPGSATNAGNRNPAWTHLPLAEKGRSRGQSFAVLCLRFMVSLVEGNIHRNPLFFNGKNHGFRLRFSIEPIRWWYHPKKQNSYWYRKNFLEQNEKQKNPYTSRGMCVVWDEVLLSKFHWRRCKLTVDLLFWILN